MVLEASSCAVLRKERFSSFFGKPWSVQRTGSHLREGGEARRSGGTTFTTFTAGSRRTLSLHSLCELCSLSDTRTLPSLCVPSNQLLLSLSSGRASVSKTSKEVINVLWFQGASVQPVYSRSAPDLRSPRAGREAGRQLLLLSQLDTGSSCKHTSVLCW